MCETWRRRLKEPVESDVMSLHRKVIVLLTTACCALALVGPLIGPSRVPAPRPLVSAAPSFHPGVPSNGDVEDAALEGLRRQATGALGQLQIKSARVEPASK